MTGEQAVDHDAALCGIAVMAKASRPGRTKTRLVPPLTPDEAAEFNSAFLKDIAANMIAASNDQSISGYMAFGPPGSEAFFRDLLPASIGLIEAWYPNFGDCLFATIDRLLDDHAGAVVLNSDSPTLPTALLVETARVLALPGDRAVLGPSIDGGYYLLGVKQRHRALFEDIAWSTEHVARQTLEQAARIGVQVHTLPAWYDVDDLEALRMLRSELCDGRPFTAALQSYAASHAKDLLCALIARADLTQRLRAGGEPAMQRAAE